MLTVDVPLNTMLADLDETLRDAAANELERHGFEGVDIAFDAPAREWSGQLSKPTVNIFLYDLRESETLRTSEWSRIQRDGRTFEGRPPMIMECSYAVTAWTQAVEDEHRLLSQVLAIFYAYPGAAAGGAQRPPRQRLAGVADQGAHRAGQGREVGLLERHRRPVQGVARLRRAAFGRLGRQARARSRSPHADRAHAAVRRTGARDRSRCIAPSAASATSKGEPLANVWVTLPGCRDAGPRAPPTDAFASTVFRPAVTGCWRGRRTAARPITQLEVPGAGVDLVIAG